jgi:hypothetical protein
MARVERILTAYPRDCEELVGEWRLAGLELNELQAMFNRPADDPMYDEYEVKPQHAERLGGPSANSTSPDSSTSSVLSR